ncbi:MAG: bifunctional riboflavin kinase/FMN adenylyltransferase [Anaerolineaceae bacterium]|nr:bifunctional riboflavin kinase/FMN adenylyltransferase [Anaerolineaceae bacterium]
MTEHIYQLTNAHLPRPSLVTIGVFDGVHKGHQHLIEQLVAAARQTGQLAVVLTFFPHPDVVLRGLTGRYYLTTAEQKAELLMSLGVDYVITHPFDDELRQVRAAQFTDQLLEHLNMKTLAVGSDFAMGYKREGNVDFLRDQGAQKGFDLQVVDLLGNNGDTISSTAIRNALQVGDVTLARKWLGRSYAVGGTVIHGAKRGRQIGFPTANLQVWDQQVIPANGIYASWVHLGDQRFMAATNVGIRPHFEGDDITVEPYILDFDRDIYGQQLTVTFEKRLRDEAKFDSLDALIAQIGADVEVVREYLSTGTG